jgi:ATP-dependent Clp endopeptidase proteolytic subunit ClpP
MVKTRRSGKLNLRLGNSRFCDDEDSDIEYEEEYDSGPSDSNLTSRGIFRLCGEVSEGNSNVLIDQLMLYMAQRQEGINAVNAAIVGEESEERIENYKALLEKFSNQKVKLTLSTYGGSSMETFGLFDILKLIEKEGITVQTFGYGKVMSAGALLLSAGTKGERILTSNCRVMIHSVGAECGGFLRTIKNDVEEVEALQEIYISRLAENSHMKKKEIQQLFQSSENLYLSAEEAVKRGLADKIASSFSFLVD